MHAPAPGLAGWGETRPSQRSWTVLLAGAPGHGSASAPGPAQLAPHPASHSALDRSQRKSLFCFSLLAGSCKDRERVKESISGCSRRPGAPTHASKSRVERGCWKPKPMPCRCPPAPLSPIASRAQEPPLPFPGIALVCKALVQAALAAPGHPPAPGERPIPTSLLLGSRPGAGDHDPAAARSRGSDPKPSCQAGKGLRKLLRCPLPGSPPASPAAGLHAHTPVDAAIVTCLRGGCHQSHQSQSGFRAAGWRSTEQLPEVLGNRGKVFLELGKVRALMG